MKLAHSSAMNWLTKQRVLDIAFRDTRGHNVDFNSRETSCFAKMFEIDEDLTKTMNRKPHTAPFGPHISIFLFSTLRQHFGIAFVAISSLA
jgi:hypothetical protein